MEERVERKEWKYGEDGSVKALNFLQKLYHYSMSLEYWNSLDIIRISLKSLDIFIKSYLLEKSMRKIKRMWKEYELKRDLSRE